ncbi:cytosolic carboxypeptidase 2 [Trichonephila clavata]|uniref:Cytosolic carboxypeptidase 2 n=1 Tax=Trichonephila clavata TaxID=2740835 RepID=A0A8X6L3Z6_TRICU|nr:cytosolic carboxypeptidase 2 [Trichonephila clavata]
MYLDLHAHTGLLGAFVYGNSYTDVYRFQRHTLFPKHLSYCAPDFSLEHTAYNKDKNKQGTSRRFLAAFLNERVNCYTLEVSFHGYEVSKGNSTSIHTYNEEEYLRLGESICHSLLDYYCATKYIPPDDVPKAVRESCCRGSRAKMVSNGNNKSPHRTASSVSGNEKKVVSQAATSKTKSTKTRAVASKVLNDQKQSANQRPAHAKKA